MKANYTPKQIALVLLLLVTLSCDETTIINQYTGTGEEKTYSIEGYAQKGPFIVGSNVTVSELNENLYPTGKVFFATILDNRGHFELPGVVLVSPYIQIKVEGSSFSETQGGVPTGVSLTLYSIADIRKSETINVNILTHLEKDRVEYLVQEESKSFDDAKKQALKELLSVFNLNDYNVNASEELTMLNESEGNAVLLTVSSIIEGIYDYERKLALITNFQKDFQDGTLDDSGAQNTLLTSAFCLDPIRIIDNLTNRFSNIQVPNFEPILEHFINNSDYTNHFSEIFTGQPNGTINLLDTPETTVLDPTKDYVFYLKPPQGVKVFMHLMIQGNYYSDEANFDAESTMWTEGASGGSCPPEPDPHCYVYKSHIYLGESNSLDILKIPINSMSGNGVLGISFTLYIDDFSHPALSFNKNFTW